MSFGPTSSDPHSPVGAADGCASSSTTMLVREAASQLLSDLERAQQQTRDWTDEAAGETSVGQAMDRCLAVLAGTRLWGRDNLVPSNEFWRCAGQRLQCGSLQWRARAKPRGYAGDFEMLAMFCQWYECDDPLGRLLDRYFQKQTAVEAVRARTEIVAAALAEIARNSTARPFYVASIGCGPAIELERAVRRLPESRRCDLSIQLLDLDEEALEHASRRLAPLLDRSQWSTSRENLLRLSERPHAGRLVQPAHYVYCTGLLDYLPDEPARRLLRFLWQQLRTGGTMYVGNFAPHNPSRAYMEWIGNWYLIYRNERQFAALAEAAGIPVQCRRFAAEPNGVDIFLIAEKQA